MAGGRIIGGGFTGVDLKVLLNEVNLHHLKTILDAGAGCGPQYGTQVAAYGRSILSLHEMCVEKTLRPDWEEAIRTFEAEFQTVGPQGSNLVPWTPKVHCCQVHLR